LLLLAVVGGDNHNTYQSATREKGSKQVEWWQLQQQWLWLGQTIVAMVGQTTISQKVAAIVAEMAVVAVAAHAETVAAVVVEAETAVWWW
jgi:hypothetical protein